MIDSKTTMNLSFWILHYSYELRSHMLIMVSRKNNECYISSSFLEMLFLIVFLDYPPNNTLLTHNSRIAHNLHIPLEFNVVICTNIFAR